jgi:hypothetical protein
MIDLEKRGCGQAFKLEVPTVMATIQSFSHPDVASIVTPLLYMYHASVLLHTASRSLPSPFIKVSVSLALPFMAIHVVRSEIITGVTRKGPR